MCSNTACKKAVLLSDPFSSEDNTLNDAAILGTRMAGVVGTVQCKSFLPV